MRHPVTIMKVIGILFLLLLFFMSATMTVQAAETINLLEIKREESSGITRVIFSFSSLPDFTMEHSAQRVDLQFSGVQPASELESLPEGETIQRVQLEKRQQNLEADVLLRRFPQQVTSETRLNPPQIIINIDWDTAAASRPAIAFGSADMSRRKAGSRASLLQKKSPWEGRWEEFFQEFRTYWNLKLPVNFTLPPLPALLKDEQSSLWPLQQHADNNMFLSLIQTATAMVNLEPQQLYLRNLLLAEAQLRAGATKAGLLRLDTLQRRAGAEQVRVEYLTAYGQALGGQPLLAQITLRQMLPELTKTHPLLPLVQFLLAETALAAGQDSMALEALQSTEINWPENLLILAKMRIADAHAGMGKRSEALAAYRTLAEEPGLFESYHFSCNRAAFSAFKTHDYKFANSLYLRLQEQVTEGAGADLIMFATGASAYRSGDLGWGMVGLQQATLTHPDTEGGDRAELLLIDHQLLQRNQQKLEQAATAYADLGERSRFLSVRKESLFKSALALYLAGDYQESVADLMRFRREFASSELIRETDLLILLQLPLLMNQLLEQNDYLAAVVLAEQNRNLLLRRGFNKDFLHNLATAFKRLGLHERASRVLLYLYDLSNKTPHQELIYLPLAQSFLNREEYQKASDYAHRYLQKFPHGNDASALFGVLLTAFEHQERQQELLSWLNRKDRPSSPELEIRAAHIYWRHGNLQAVIDSLERAARDGEPLQVKEMALLGEAHYQLQQNSAAEKIYRQLHEDPDFGAQARYRTAQILLRQQQRLAGLNLLQQLVETDGDSPWGKLAQDLLIEEQH